MTPRDYAESYDERNWCPVPVPHREKAPRIRDWPNYADGASGFNGEPMNIGVILGERSGGLVDVDLDTAEARSVADAMLPETGAVFGRLSSARSHWLYVAVCETRRFQAPDGQSLVEIRSTGAQTVFPGSQHPSGELIDWHVFGEPARVDAAVLVQACSQLAAAALLAHSWPSAGSRHDAALALAGGLLRCGFDADSARTFMRAVADAAGDPEAADRVAAVATSEKRIQAGEPATGWTSLAAHVGGDVVKAVRFWLGATQDDPTEDTATRLSDFSIGRVLRDRATWQPVKMVSTGIPSLDDALGGGFRIGGVSLIVGKSGRAKTTSAIQVAVNAASADVPVGIVSLEMARRDVAHLVAANLSGVSRSWIANNTLQGNQTEQLREAVATASRWPLTVLDDDYWRRPLTRTGLAEIVERGREQCGWQLVVLDYAGLIAREQTDAGEYQTDVANSAEFKRIARRSSVALVVIAAMRKSGTFKGASDTPSLDDVLGAGRLVYDCENVLYLDCEQVGGHGVEPSGSVFIHPLKTRFSGAGSSGEILTLNWKPTTGQVFDAARSESEVPY